jgi:hypothetical protein
MNEIRTQADAAMDRLRAARRPASRLPLVVVGLAGAVAGAFLAFVLDPQMGRTRRALTRDQLAGGARRLGRWSTRRARYVASTAEGLSQRLQRSSRAATGGEPLDDVALAHKVESILFRDPDIEKGDININAEHGAVFLRGTVADRARADEIRRRVTRIDGVGAVVNLLRIEGDGGIGTTEEAEDRPLWTAPR